MARTKGEPFKLVPTIHVNDKIFNESMNYWELKPGESDDKELTIYLPKDNTPWDLTPFVQPLAGLLGGTILRAVRSSVVVCKLPMVDLDGMPDTKFDLRRLLIESQLSSTTKMVIQSRQILRDPAGEFEANGTALHGRNRVNLAATKDGFIFERIGYLPGWIHTSFLVSFNPSRALGILCRYLAPTPESKIISADDLKDLLSELATPLASVPEISRAISTNIITLDTRRYCYTKARCSEKLEALFQLADLLKVDIRKTIFDIIGDNKEGLQKLGAEGLNTLAAELDTRVTSWLTEHPVEPEPVDAETVSETP
jgi:hypothetical protein